MKRLLVTTLILACVSLASAQTALDIVRRSVDAALAQRELPLRRQYTWQQHEVSNEGAKLFDVLYIGGKEYRRLLEKNGHPLSADEQRKEQERLDKAARMDESERLKREREAAEREAKELERLRYVPDAFQFTLVGYRIINGRAAYEVTADPKPGYDGKYAFLLRNIRARLFIDKQDLHWARVEAEALDTVSVGLLLARIGKGTVVSFEETRINNEVWLPKTFHIKATGRLALLKKLDVEASAECNNYRRFQTDSRVVAVTGAAKR
ncbi:MAG: hypothetical protein ABI693_11555 [Bryobacteraceae bacterium]